MRVNLVGSRLVNAWTELRREVLPCRGFRAPRFCQVLHAGAPNPADHALKLPPSLVFAVVVVYVLTSTSVWWCVVYVEIISIDGQPNCLFAGRRSCSHQICVSHTCV